jgi:hypothetical protein
MPDEVKPGDKAAEEKDEKPPLESKEAQESKDEKKEEKKDEFNPSPDHPRFKEVYYKLKKAERDLEERGKDVEALRAHSNELAAAVAEMKKVKASDEPEPDIATDPEGYKAWTKLQMTKKDREFQDNLAKQRLATQIEIQAELHDDYDEAVKIADREMVRDPALKKKVYESGNPAREAYRLGRKYMDDAAKKDKDEQERQERLDAGTVHKDSPPPVKDAPPEEKLSDAEKRVIRNLFPDMEFKEAAKKYAETRKSMAGAGRG